MASRATLKSRRIEAPDSLDAINDLFYERGWTDGLPIVPPTEERVASMMETWGYNPAQVLGRMAPRMGLLTVEKVAINAVMAGCKPEHFPVVLAAVKAVLKEEFNLGGIQVTTGGAAPLIVVNGPIASQLDINAGTGCFGSGFRANATIGRALRLVMLNVGGATTGVLDRSTQGHPGKYTCCIAENEARSPWEPLHVELGYPRDSSTVTVASVRGFHQISESTIASAVELLRSVAGAMTPLGLSIFYLNARGSQVVLALGPEHAAFIAAAGFTKEDVKAFLFEHARIPMERLRGRGHWAAPNWPPWIDPEDPSCLVPICSRPQDFIVMVAGGDGNHSLWMPIWTSSRAVTVPIE